jgi:23S rRNA (cytidine1920-2'-O)/16S rRNA (cytidine1409-2'-O)-methyltransferase
VRDPEVHARVLQAVAAEAHRVGLTDLAVEPSPVTGAQGNREFFMLLKSAR